MLSTSWFSIVIGLLFQSVVLTAFFYREFATKRDLARLESHLRELAQKDYVTLIDRIDAVHEGISEIKESIKDIRNG